MSNAYVASGRIRQWARRVFRSGVGWFFAAIHTVALMLFVANMPPADQASVAAAREATPASPDAAGELDLIHADETMYAGRSFALWAEPVPTKVLFYADLPALLISVGVGAGLTALGVIPSDFIVQSYWLFALHAVFGALQWLVMGAWLRRRVTGGSRKGIGR